MTHMPHTLEHHMLSLAQALEKACTDGEEAAVLAHLNNNAQDPHGHALHTACVHGHINVVRLLLDSSLYAEHTFLGGGFVVHYALGVAATSGQTDMVRWLLHDRRARDPDGEVLRSTAALGHTACVALLVQHLHNTSDPNFSSALVSAAVAGKVECVRVLMACFSDEHLHHLALKQAALNGHNDCVDVLWDSGAPAVALAELRKKHPQRHAHWAYLAIRVESMQQASTLTTSVGVPQDLVLKCRHKRL